MKKNIFWLALALFLLGDSISAQVNTYSFSQGAGSPTLLTAAYTQHGSGTIDDVVFTNIPIGFTFNFNCVNYTAVSIANNGWIDMGASLTSSYFPLSSGSDNNVISVLGADLQGNTTSFLRSKTAGVAGSRTFTVEWQNYRMYAGTENYTFQIVLHETTNIIEFYYSDAAAFVAGNSFQVGLRGNSNADFNNRTKITGTSWNASSAGVSNTDAMIAGNSAATSPSGLFTFTPTASACAGTPAGGTAAASPNSITSCASQNTTLSLSGGSTGCGIAYQWQSSAAAGGPWANIAGATSSTYSASVSTTTYFRCIVTCSNSGLTSTSSVATVTVTTSPPANDNCSGAIALTMNPYGSCASVSAGDLSCSTASGTAAGACFGNPDDDIWYSFVATSTVHYVTLTTTSGFDAYMQLYSGSCGSLTSLQCSDPDVFTATGLTIGQTYYIRVYSYSVGKPAVGTLNMCVSAPPACPANLGSGNINVASLPYSSGAGTTCGAGDDITSSNAATCGSTFYFTGEDKVWIFTPSSSGQVTISLSSTGTWTGLMLYQGCPFSGACVGNSQSSTGNKTMVVCVTAGVTYYLVLDSDAAPTCNAYSNLTISAVVPPGSCSSSLGTGVVNVASLPYTSLGRTTCGKVDDLTSSNMVTCGSSSYFTGEDEVFIFTPAASGNITFSITSTGSYTGMMLYDGCPVTTNCSGVTGNCVAFNQDFNGSKSMCYNVTAGVTYYLVIDSYSTPVCNPYDITITAPSGIPAGTTCVNAVNIASLPFSATGQTTACFGNDYTNTSTGSCGTLYESGEDKVYKYIASGPECIAISLTNASTSSIGFQVYNGCPGAAGTTCVDNGGGATSGTLTGQSVLPSAGTYYIIVDEWSTPFNANYDIAITSYGSGPSNDLPCGATSLPLSVNVTGDNSCSSGTGEPAAPACWSGGTLNTVWFSVVCPASGQLKIRTQTGTLMDTQIDVYSGACGSLTFVTGSCNNDAASCGSTSYLNSDVTLTGLTSGATYFVRVDGGNNTSGTFSIMAIDGTTTFPDIAGQECAVANPVCNQTVNVGNPGYRSYGNTCDFPGGGTNCLASGERGSQWYTININAAGTLTFDIVPNDWPGAPSTAGTDYDFGLWRITGAGATTCAGISGGAAPLRCNYSSLGITGIYTTAGTAPAAYPGFGGAYDANLTVAAGDVLVLVVSNFSNNASGYTLNFGSSSPINYASSPTSVTWTGGANTTSWPTTTNWGGCTIPSCGVDAVISGGPASQPVLVANTSVKNLTINAGATLTINSGVTLTICGDYTNNGTLNALAGSTILFNNGSVVHNLYGTLTGTSKFPNLTITKTGGSVITNQNIDIGGNFTTSNSTSVFNSNGKYVKIAGNFVNATGNTTFTSTGTTGTLEFNGTAAQTYNQGTSQLDLNNVVMNHTGTGVTLQTDMNIKATTGTLTLTLGKIITTATYKVIVNNSTTTSVSSGNTNSYVYGFLRRYINNSTGAFDFPVGTSTAYERANVNFTAAPTITYLTADFQTYGAVPGPLGTSECGSTYNMNALDNGFWNIDANTANNNTGTYNMTLYNTNYTNASSGWTVMARHNGSATWATVNGDGSAGTCVPSPVTAVVRNNMKGFSKFGTAQSNNPLPIELISFSGKNEGVKNKLEWTTVSELNNDFYSVEHSSDGYSFEEFITKDGAGNSSSRKNYEAFDYTPFVGITYYRLKQVDFDGQFTYSSIISVKNNLDAISVSNVHPNPTSNDLNFDFYSPVKGTVNIQIMDLTGRVVMQKTQMLQEGRSSLNTEMGNLSKGVYSLKVEFSEGGFRSLTKVVKY